ncbi:MAG: NACHT domain-containing protein [Cyanobacteriota bacterium]|nr:NACHT domain-containing protein [Cyanobacteriota bacterium]
MRGVSAAGLGVAEGAAVGAGALEGQELEGPELERFRRAYGDQSPRPILEVVVEASLRKLVVLGDPGSGNSLLLQALVLGWAECAAPDAQQSLPVSIELREYARWLEQGQVTGFVEFLARAEGLGAHFEREALQKWLRHRPSRVLFDGLDEVFDAEQRQRVCSAIQRFADDHPAAQVVVSSRVIGFLRQSWGHAGFRPFMLQERDDEQIATFLRRWHQAAYEDGGKGERKRAQLCEALARCRPIEQLAHNPLLLTLMAILNRTQELPRDRSELYHRCARLLLDQWKTDEAFARDPVLAKALLDYKDKRDLLMAVAWRLQASTKGLAGNLMEEEDLEHFLSEGLRGIAELRPERSARALIEQLRGSNFMLCAVGSGNYGFVHRTFLEYFCDPSHR